MRGRGPEEGSHACEHVAGVGAGEERGAGVHLDEEAAEAPDVDGRGVREAEEDLGRAVVAALDAAARGRGGGGGVGGRGRGAAKVDELDARAVRVAEEHVLGLHVAVHDADLGPREERERRQQLPPDRPHQVQRHAPKARQRQQLVQAPRKKLKDQTQVVPIVEVMSKLNCSVWLGRGLGAS